jgi:hypothetical protein
MSKAAVWWMLGIVFFALIGLLVYADHVGNVRLTEALIRIFEFTVGAMTGAIVHATAK